MEPDTTPATLPGEVVTAVTIRPGDRVLIAMNAADDLDPAVVERAARELRVRLGCPVEILVATLPVLQVDRVNVQADPVREVLGQVLTEPAATATWPAPFVPAPHGAGSATWSAPHGFAAPEPYDPPGWSRPPVPAPPSTEAWQQRNDDDQQRARHAAALADVTGRGGEPARARAVGEGTTREDGAPPPEPPVYPLPDVLTGGDVPDGTTGTGERSDWDLAADPAVDAAPGHGQDS